MTLTCKFSTFTHSRNLPLDSKAARQHTNFSTVQRATTVPRFNRSDSSTQRPLVLGQRTRASHNEAQLLVSNSQPTSRSFDFLVLGSGIAGLTYALKVARYGSVAVVTKESASEGCTLYAQGGVSAVLAEMDSFESHVHDTLVAGDFLNCKQAVEAVCREGPAEVLKLGQLGANFTQTRNGSYHLTQEGGHSARRVVHAEDATGREIQRALLSAANSQPNITFLEHHLATELVVDEVCGVPHCLGIDALDGHNAAMTRLVAPVTMLATGGAGQVYPITTNPGVTTGDGIAMAARASARICGMEFVQFHPTGFFSGQASASSRTFLISEAVRGEGGHLLNRSGERFMSQYDSRLELAPRDVVARAIQDQMLERGDTHVLLDISHCQPDHIRTHFPNITAQCLSHGIDVTTQPIPVAPAAHYICGGVQTGLLGETSIAGLYAAGEVACTGLHGANRLASNSLLEGLVFANRAVDPSVSHAEYALQHGGSALHHAATHADFTGSSAPARLQETTRDWVAARRMELKTVMWSNAGIVRNTKDMSTALQRLTLMSLEAQAMLRSYGVAIELVELQNLATVATQILKAALLRKESRGGHFNVDYPPTVAARQVQHKAPRGSSVQQGTLRNLCSDQELGRSVRGRSPQRQRWKKRDIILRSQPEDQS